MADLGTHSISSSLALNLGLLYWEVRVGVRLRHLNLVQRLGVPELRGVDDHALMRDAPDREGHL